VVKLAGLRSRYCVPSKSTPARAAQALMLSIEIAPALVSDSSLGKSNVRFSPSARQQFGLPFSSAVTIMPLSPPLTLIFGPVRNRLNEVPSLGAGNRTSASEGSSTNRLEFSFHQLAQRRATSSNALLS